MPPEVLSRVTFEAIGTRWEIDTREPLTEVERSGLDELIDEFDCTYSRFRDDSLVAQLEKDAGTWTFPDDAVALVELYRSLYRATDGAMTPLVGPSLESLGYGRDLTLEPGSARASEKWDDAMSWNGSTVSTTRGVGLDVGAAGKGLLVDHVSDFLSAHHPVLVDASGDMRYRGAEPIRVALEHPYDARRAIGVVELAGGALCASATNRRAWGDGLHHVLDGRTGLPVREVAATWVMAPTAMVADALATALFFVGPERLADVADFSYVRMFTDGRAEYSPTLSGEIFR